MIGGPLSDAKPLGRGRALATDFWALIRPRRWMFAGGFVLMGISRGAGLVLPVSTKFLIDDIVGHHRRDLLLPLVIVVLAATILQAVTSFAVNQLLAREAQRLMAELRQRLQEHISRLPVSFHDATRTGTLVSRIMHDVEGVRHLVGAGMVQFAGALLTAVIAFVLIIRISVGMTVVTLLAMIVYIVVLGRRLRTLRPLYREAGHLYATVSGRLSESLGGIRVVKGYHAEEREASVFAGGIQRLLDNLLRTQTFASSMGMWSTIVLGVAATSVMYAGARQILAGTLTVGSFFTYLMLLGLLVMPLFQIVGVGTQLTEAVVGVQRAREILTLSPEDDDPRRQVVLPDVRGSVAFENVHFSYDSGPPVLHDISFHVRPGSVTAIVGPSGAGKTTILSLLAAFHAPTSGRILIDGVDLSTLRLDAYRTRLGIVLQEPFLFSGTIRENVAFARPDATDAAIVAACRMARVDEFAERLPNGYDTMVGERAVKLSGGQRQRVAIARAILADSRILFLDEATSNLDSASEALIEESLTEVMRGRTTFVIAHRLSTIRRADHILVLEHGRIVERGDHLSLRQARGRYFELHAKQLENIAESIATM
jgi:ABC-type multidrug transport system fused ATPase/permease subunit